MTLRALSLAMTSALLTVAPLTAQDAAAVFDRLQGTWVGDGTLFGRPARFTMRWEHTDGFAVLRFGNALADTSGRLTPVLNAAAVYRTSPDRAEGVWLDSRGVRVEIRWEASDSALVANWTAPSETGRTTYRAVTTGQLEVVDEVATDTGWRTFGTARYRPADGPG